jgi:hypothetical protein
MPRIREHHVKYEAPRIARQRIIGMATNVSGPDPVVPAS